jgi:glucose/arabinose dehydrogenase
VRGRLSPLAAAGVALLLASGCMRSSAGAPTRTPSPSPSPSSSAAPLPLSLEPLGSFSSPVWVGPAPGDPTHLYLVQRGGTVLRLGAQGQRQDVLLDLGDEVSSGNEQGLLSMAFDPAYPRVSRIYVDYTDLDGNTRVVAYTVVHDRAVRPQLLLTVASPYPNHNGGQLLFDRTGMLLIGTGDGGNAGDPENRAQNVGSLLGKILRIDPRTGAAAPGNPYQENRYVWAMGLRNPTRFVLDTNGDLYLGDSGQNREEELDVVPRGLQRAANYGWSVYEGNERFKQDEEFTPGGPLIVPALSYPHSDGGCLIVVGSVYRGRAVPALRGSFVFGDYCQGRLLAVTRTANGVTALRDLDVRAESLEGFGVDAHGELLVLTVDKLERLVPGG